MPRPRLAVFYRPVLATPTWPGPGLALHRTPQPGCPDCDGAGFTATDPDCLDETSCRCAPDTPIVTLPLPRIVNRYHRRRLVRRLRFTH